MSNRKNLFAEKGVRVLTVEGSSDEDLRRVPILLKKLEKAGKVYESFHSLVDRLYNKYGYAYIVHGNTVYKVGKKEWTSVRMRTVDLSLASKWEQDAVLNGNIDEVLAHRDKESKKNDS